MPAAEWTVMVFLNGDNNLEPFALTDFREMAQVGSTAKVNIVAQVDRNGGHAVTSPQWRGCYRFHISAGTKPAPAEAIADLGDTNMGSGTVLRQFVDWAMERYSAKKYLLEIWNHGQGWRFFRAQPPSVTGVDLHEFREFRLAQITRETARRQDRMSRLEPPDAAGAGAPPLPALPVDLSAPGTVRYVSHDDTSNDVLFNREIQDSLNGLTLDVIGFDACLMAMIETAFAVRNVARVMVGSEELEPGDGWNYVNWLRTLTAHPEMNAADLAATLVRSYGETYHGRDETVTLSAIDLSRVAGLAESVDRLASELIGLDTERLGAVKQARGQCEAYAPGYGLHGIDLARFCQQLAKVSVPAATKTAARAVVQQISSAVTANFAGDDRQDRFGSSGLAIYFPETRALFEADPDHVGYIKSNAQYPVEFVQKYRWADFLLTRYFKSF